MDSFKFLNDEEIKELDFHELCLYISMLNKLIKETNKDG